MYPFERCMKVIKGHVRNRNKPEGCIAEETIMEETIEFFSEYHKSMETIGIPPGKHETYENEEGKPLSAGKSSEVSAELFQKAHLYVIQNTDEIVPYIDCSFNLKLIYTCNEIQVERELVISKESVSATVRWISYGLRATVVKYDAYNINGYTFRTKCHDDKVYQNSGVSVEAIDLHISKEVATTRQAFYYGVLQDIWVLDYRFMQIPLFKCDWVNHRASDVKGDNLRYTLVDLNNLGHKTPPKNYKDTYDEVDEEFSTVIHQRNDNILPCVNRRDLGNESRDDYYQTDYGACTLHLQLAYAHCICTLHLQLAFASKHLHIAFADCICTLLLYIAFAACICKQAFAHCTCTLHLQAKVLIKTLLKVKQVENKQREKKPRFNKQFL
ncbi:putative transposon, En/Spm-like protein [Tanacetum coccineum]